VVVRNSDCAVVDNVDDITVVLYMAQKFAAQAAETTTTTAFIS
jgi:hypothetical protein